MSDDDKTLTPTGEAEKLIARYNAAEGKFDRFLILVSGMRYTLIMFAVWTVLMLYVGARVFG